MALIWDSAGVKGTDRVVVWCRGLVRSWHSEFQSLLGTGWPWAHLLPPPHPCWEDGLTQMALEDISAKHLESQALHSHAELRQQAPVVGCSMSCSLRSVSWCPIQ